MFWVTSAEIHVFGTSEVLDFCFFLFKKGRLALLHFGLAALEEVEGIRGFRVDVLDHGEDIQDVLFCKGGLVATIEVVLFYQDLEGQEQSNKNTLSACAKGLFKLLPLWTAWQSAVRQNH